MKRRILMDLIRDRDIDIGSERLCRMDPTAWRQCKRVRSAIRVTIVVVRFGARGAWAEYFVRWSRPLYLHRVTVSAILCKALGFSAFDGILIAARLRRAAFIFDGCYLRDRTYKLHVWYENYIEQCEEPSSGILR